MASVPFSLTALPQQLRSPALTQLPCVHRNVLPSRSAPRTPPLFSRIPCSTLQHQLSFQRDAHAASSVAYRCSSSAGMGTSSRQVMLMGRLPVCDT